MNCLQSLKNYINKTTSSAPLAVFRIAFGLLIFISIVRFWANGWIEMLYIEPRNFFSFYGFEFIRPLGSYTYLIFIVCALSALLVVVGWHYRLAMISLFVSFTYIELMDKSTYLNHYYFVSLVCMLMIFLPAYSSFSIDAWRTKRIRATQVPQWCVDVLKVFIGMVYVYAGLAKLNSDWLVHAQPLRIWLPAHNDLPVLGGFLQYTWMAYAFSWLGCLYDLSIPFFLMNSRTRPYAYLTVIVFHTLTVILFPIGMFPYIMIVTALVFFSPEWHERLLRRLRKIMSISSQETITTYQYSKRTTRIILGSFLLFFVIQLTAPWRHLLYPDEVFWTEEGYRFSWRVMLMEKAGYAEFTVIDNQGNKVVVNNKDFLTPLQEKMMATQPDMILQYAHILKNHFIKEGFHSPQVYVDSYVVLNGRLGRTFVDPSVDLAKIEESFRHKFWITPFQDEIKGL